jgi:hypothetical protein
VTGWLDGPADPVGDGINAVSRHGHAGTPEEDAIAGAVGTLRRVPDEHRSFTVDAAALSRVHRIDPPLLARLLDFGFPHRGAGPMRRFDPFDAENLGLALALPCPRRLGMRWWSRTFRDVNSGRPFRTTIAISASGLAAGDRSDCSLDPQVLAAAVPGTVAQTEPGAFRLDPRLEDIRHVFDESYAWIGKLAASVQFHLLPYSLQRNLSFLKDTGLADCRLAALFLTKEAKERGAPVRKAEGLILGRPYASWHAWIEVDVHGRWIALDPFFLRTLADWGVIDRAIWPPNRSPHPLMWRLHSDYVPMMYKGGVPLAPTAITPSVFTKAVAL